MQHFILKLRALFSRDYWWAEFISVMITVGYGASNYIAPPSPFKLQFLQPLLELTSEENWNIIFICSGLAQLVALYMDDHRVRYLAAVPCATLLGSLLSSMVISDQVFPARTTLLLVGMTINGIALFRHTRWLFPHWREHKAGT